MGTAPTDDILALRCGARFGGTRFFGCPVLPQDRGGQMTEAADTWKLELMSNPDDWVAAEGYLDCMLPSTRTVRRKDSTTTPPDSDGGIPLEVRGHVEY
jgi:hypothetical protein